jgi:ribosome-associated protein
LNGTEAIDLGSGVALDPADVAWRFSTAGGPGGQHANTSHTRAEASLDLDAAVSLPDWARQRLRAVLRSPVTAVAGESRSQSQNRQVALDRLAERLRRALAPPPAPRRPTRPGPAARRRRLAAKRHRSELKRQRRFGAADD